MTAITYIPEVVDGNQIQGDSITKYDITFNKGQTVDVTDEGKAAKMLTCPFFEASMKIDEKSELLPNEVKKAPKKKPPKKKLDS